MKRFFSTILFLALTAVPFSADVEASKKEAVIGLAMIGAGAGIAKVGYDANDGVLYTSRARKGAGIAVAVVGTVLLVKGGRNASANYASAKAKRQLEYAKTLPFKFKNIALKR